MSLYIKRAYNEFKLINNFQILIKTSVTDKLAHEIKYYHLINKTPYSIYFPRLIDSTILKNNNKLCIEFYAYKNLYEELKNDTNIFNNVSGSILKLLKDFSNEKSKGNISFKSKIYKEKTINEYEYLIKNFPFFNNFQNHSEIVINNKKYKNFNQIKKNILNLINEILINKDDFNIIHGDLCFSNILLGQNPEHSVIKLIDPRGSFGKIGIYGDALYDWAKLRHSYHGRYEDIINDEFTINCKNNICDLTFQNNYNTLYTELFERNLSQQFIKKIKLIEGLIFIGMCARHFDSLNRQKAMYLNGIKILNEVLE